VVARQEVEDDRGKFALERGPIVYCLEGQDNQDGHVLSLVVPDDSKFRTAFQSDILGGVHTITGSSITARRDIEGGIVVGRSHEFTAIPYYAWAHRGASEMAVWLAREVDAAKPLPAPTLAFRAKLTASGGQGLEALTDQLPPKSSNDHSVPYFHWWPKKGTVEWLQFDFGKSEKVSHASIYWFDDTGTGECRVPKSWKLLYRMGSEWKRVQNVSGDGLKKDQVNIVSFTGVETDALRLEIHLQEEFSAGLYEWGVK
jgi:hypothetical protein